ncbi:MAG: nucleoside recognition domain-containing protein [Desulforegulaceae bacterium]|nr:nucleoside recognition domain-containing protein [Desulforegulaceae bacterium]
MFFLKNFFNNILPKTYTISFDLFKIMIPMTILTKILEYFGAVEFTGKILSPLMGLMGLDGELGLVWAASMITNIYGGLSVFAAIYPGLNVSSCDITILSLIILVAHSLPVELGIARKAGAKIFPMFLLRFLSAVIMGILLSFAFNYFELFQYPAKPIWSPEIISDQTFFGEILAQCISLFYIFLIILSLVFLMDIFEKIKFMDWLTRKITFFISPLGIGEKAGFMAVTGFTLGISYGGGLIINEAKSGNLTKREIFFSLSLMGLSHGMIEDTILMAAIGGSLWGILVARIFFSFVFIWIIVKLSKIMSDKKFNLVFMESE